MTRRQNDILWQSPSGWTIEVVYAERPYLIVASPNGWNDNPIRYEHNGRIAYDYPERIPDYVQRQVDRFLGRGCSPRFLPEMDQRRLRANSSRTFHADDRVRVSGRYRSGIPKGVLVGDTGVVVQAVEQNSFTGFRVSFVLLDRDREKVARGARPGDLIEIFSNEALDKIRS